MIEVLYSINESIDLSNKICYKCAYELDQCTKFVQKYRNSHKVPEPKVETSMRCCFLCYELVESNRIFDISKDKSVFNPLRKIRSIFNDDINKKNNSWLICLTCRYNLDVLYDLKRIYQDSFNNLKALINEEINYSNYPKIHTDVVNRKTTITTFPDITFYGSINSDSDSNEDMARSKRHIKGRKAQSNVQMKSQSNKSKVRSCDKCHNTVANDIDMYRFYRTGLTVCKNCWITMDPSIAKSQRRSRQIQSKTETKLCAVFLKDVLSHESLKKEEKDETHEIEKDKTCETEKDESRQTVKDKTRETVKDKTRETVKDKTCEMEKNEIHNTEKDKAHEMEKDKDDNASFVNSQEEAKYSEESSSLSISPKMRNHIINGKARRGKKRKIGVVRSRSDVERTPSKVTRISNEHTDTNEEKSSKTTIDTEQQPDTQLMKTRGRKRIDNRSSDSEGSQKQKAFVDAEQQSSTQQTKKQGRKRPIDNRSSDSDSPQKRKISVDAEQQSNTHLTKTRGRKRIMDNKSSDSEGSQKQKETDKIKLNENVHDTKKKQKIKGTTSSARSDSSDEISIEENKSLKNRLKVTSSSTTPTKKEQESNIRSRTRSSSMSSTEMTSTEFKSPKSLSQSEVKTEYTCDKCNKKFDSKLSSAKHKLTHLKQAALKLEKITVANIKVKQETDLISQDEIFEEVTSRSDRTISIDKCTDDSLEDAIINVEDNTNDEPCSLGDTKNAKEKMEEKKSDESSDTDEKPDVATSESRLEEESTNDENIEKTKSEKCKNSVTSDDTVIEIKDDEDRSNKDVKDEHTTKDEDKTLDRDSDKFEDNDAQEATVAILKNHKNVENENKEKDKDVEIKNDTEVLSTEKENISECNNDKDDKEATSDNEMTSLSILSNHNRTKDNKDQDESCENNFIDDDRDEIIEEPEIQSDLIDESSKIHIEESEENLPEILPTDETGTLNEKNDLDDIIAIEEIEQLQKQQNKSNEENTEVEIIADVDEPNSVRDMPDLLNGETHDEVMEDDVEDITINSDNDVDGTKKEIEDTVQTDKHRKLEEELKELEELVVESNAMNNKYEVQEDSTYVPDNSSADAATEILKEVFDLAAAEVQQREEIITKTLVEDVGMEMETLENISREIRKSADMPSLDPISVMDIDDDGIMLN
ncbi:PREDICTED: nipped-B-like protein B isoform X2 [Trachymyrmex septentrionalis]|uniref:nipped-B-like protein B isoform X2 n=1 Tax=Trachymyrmex septentrionalis TaxID=34720 RepID=UPI00084EF288|nr:PREDICTED: nipped-B-like protein B isoform X2 [Trachymyrmex septentrionalis]